jgi:hypothetical protein
MISFILTIWVLTSLLYTGNWLRSGVPEFGHASIGKAVRQAGSLSFNMRNLQAPFSVDGGLSSVFRAVLTGRFLYVSMGGGFVIGALSTLAGGCVLRQHVLLAQGNMDALFFMLGFYGAVVIYYGFLFKFLVRLY